MREQLIAEVGVFVEKMKGRKTIYPCEQTELFDFWKRITGETIYCTTCGRVTGEIFKNVETWHEKRKMEIDLEIVDDVPVFVDDVPAPKKKKTVKRKR
jgi:hypothetical protein